MKNTLLVFDIDGTLTDSVSVHQSAFQKALTDFGFKDFDTNWHSYRHHTDSFIFKTIFEEQSGASVTEEDIRSFERFITTNILSLTLQQPIGEISGARQMLQRLQQYPGYKTVLATGSLAAPARIKLAQSGINTTAPLVAANSLFTREDLVQKAIDTAVDLYQVAGFDEIISFGDGRWDLETARNLGIRFVGIANNSLCQYEPDHFYIDFFDDKLSELLFAGADFNATIAASQQ